MVAVLRLLTTVSQGRDAGTCSPILGCAMRGTWWGSSSAFVSQFLLTLALPVINACSKLHTAERERKLANSRFTKKPPQQVH